MDMTTVVNWACEDWSSLKAKASLPRQPSSIRFTEKGSKNLVNDWTGVEKLTGGWIGQRDESVGLFWLSIPPRVK